VFFELSFKNFLLELTSCTPSSTRARESWFSRFNLGTRVRRQNLRLSRVVQEVS